MLFNLSGKTRTKDKYRVVYTEPQRVELEKEFLYSKYITIKRKSELSLTLSLSERQIKIWFQNRRAKDRKTSRKQRIESNNCVSSTTRNSDYSNGTFNDKNDSDISIDEDDMSDSEDVKTSNKKPSKKQKLAAKDKNVTNNSSSDDLDEKRQTMQNFNPYFQAQQNFTPLGALNQNLSPSSSSFVSYNQINSTPNYYFNQESQTTSTNAHLSCQTNDYYNSYQYGHTVAPISNNFEYNSFQQAAQNDQYNYYQQQHLLLNGGSV